MFHAIARNALHFCLATGIFNTGTSVGVVLAYDLVNGKNILSGKP